MEDKIKKIIKKLNTEEENWVKWKHLLNRAEYDYERQECHILSQPKEYWQSLKITNADGRKAFVNEQIGEKKQRMNEIKKEILLEEVEIKKLKRELNLYMTLLSKE